MVVRETFEYGKLTAGSSPPLLDGDCRDEDVARRMKVFSLGASIKSIFFIKSPLSYLTTTKLVFFSFFFFL